MGTRTTIPKHLYSRDPHSGAGNCWCGRSHESRLHPHEFTPAHIDPMNCVCGGVPNHPMHCTDDEWLTRGRT